MIIFDEAEDFEIVYGAKTLGRFLVNSQEPWEVDFKKEYLDRNGDIYETINDLLKSGRIVEYKPNYRVDVSLFDDDVTIKKVE